MRKFPGQGSNQTCSCRLTPQPQECQIQATSSTYAATFGNAKSLNLQSEARDHILTDACWVLNLLSHKEEFPSSVFIFSTPTWQQWLSQHQGVTLDLTPSLPSHIQFITVSAV